MDWNMFGHDTFVSASGALALLVGQRISHWQKTWKCPYCMPPKKVSFTSSNKKLREEIAKQHIRDAHPLVASQ